LAQRRLFLQKLIFLADGLLVLVLVLLVMGINLTIFLKVVRGRSAHLVDKRAEAYLFTSISSEIVALVTC
jgi:hypothetical protein